MEKRILYFDILSGISGDMTIGALLDLDENMNINLLKSELQKIDLVGYKLQAKKTQKNGITGTKFDVILDIDEQNYSHDHVHNNNHQHKHKHDHSHEHKHDHSHEHKHGHSHEHKHGRTYKDIVEMIEISTLKDNVKKLAKEMFLHIGLAEAKVHDKSIDEVHFHEVGAVDSIVDILGVAICIDAIGVDEIISSPVHVGSGFVKCQHGVIPVPAPATLEILKGVPLYSKGIRSELVTPTGAGIIKTLATDYVDLPEMVIEKIGYGHGTKELEITNSLRVIIGKKSLKSGSNETIVVLETNIDDMSSEFYTYLYDKLFENNALDIYSTPIYMKKNRPAYKLSVICNKSDKEELEKIIFKETTTFGVRSYEVERNILDRNFTQIETKFGEITVKNGYLDKELIKSSFEFEELKSLAIEHDIPLQKVINECAKQIGEKC